MREQERGGGREKIGWKGERERERERKRESEAYKGSVAY